MSNPSNAPVRGFRKPNRYASCATPTRTRPFATICAIELPAGIAPRGGNPPGRKLAVASQDWSPR
ncbi:hypothetical protein GCM10027088_47520 [Nocardia goodfellowii]